MVTTALNMSLSPREPVRSKGRTHGRIYVSGPSRSLEVCAEAIALVRQSGHTVAVDWPPLMMANPDPLQEYLDRAITLDVEGVASSDGLLLLVTGEPSQGMWAEAGIARGLGLPSVAVIWPEAHNSAARHHREQVAWCRALTGSRWLAPSALEARRRLMAAIEWIAAQW